MRAVSAQHADVVRLLVHHGASIRCTNREGEKALDVALRKGNMHIATMVGYAFLSRGEETAKDFAQRQGYL
jgi:ankyrin repeat protein